MAYLDLHYYLLFRFRFTNKIRPSAKKKFSVRSFRALHQAKINMQPSITAGKTNYRGRQSTDDLLKLTIINHPFFVQNIIDIVLLNKLP
jgi:hypothetical protein